MSLWFLLAVVLGLAGCNDESTPPVQGREFLATAYYNRWGGDPPHWFDFPDASLRGGVFELLQSGRLAEAEWAAGSPRLAPCGDTLNAVYYARAFWYDEEPRVILLFGPAPLPNAGTYRFGREAGQPGCGYVMVEQR